MEEEKGSAEPGTQSKAPPVRCGMEYMLYALRRRDESTAVAVVDHYLALKDVDHMPAILDTLLRFVVEDIGPISVGALSSVCQLFNPVERKWTAGRAAVVRVMQQVIRAPRSRATAEHMLVAVARYIQRQSLRTPAVVINTGADIKAPKTIDDLVSFSTLPEQQRRVCTSTILWRQINPIYTAEQASRREQQQPNGADIRLHTTISQIVMTLLSVLQLESDQTTRRPAFLVTMATALYLFNNRNTLAWVRAVRSQLVGYDYMIAGLKLPELPTRTPDTWWYSQDMTDCRSLTIYTNDQTQKAPRQERLRNALICIYGPLAFVDDSNKTVVEALFPKPLALSTIRQVVYSRQGSAVLGFGTDATWSVEATWLLRRLWSALCGLPDCVTVQQTATSQRSAMHATAEQLREAWLYVEGYKAQPDVLSSASSASSSSSMRDDGEVKIVASFSLQPAARKYPITVMPESKSGAKSLMQLGVWKDEPWLAFQGDVHAQLMGTNKGMHTYWAKRGLFSVSRGTAQHCIIQWPPQAFATKFTECSDEGNTVAAVLQLGSTAAPKAESFSIGTHSYIA